MFHQDPDYLDPPGLTLETAINAGTTILLSARTEFPRTDPTSADVSVRQEEKPAVAADAEMLAQMEFEPAGQPSVRFTRWKATVVAKATSQSLTTPPLRACWPSS